MTYTIEPVEQSIETRSYFREMDFRALKDHEPVHFTRGALTYLAKNDQGYLQERDHGYDGMVFRTGDWLCYTIARINHSSSGIIWGANWSNTAGAMMAGAPPSLTASGLDTIPVNECRAIRVSDIDGQIDIPDPPSAGSWAVVTRASDKEWRVHQAAWGYREWRITET